MKEIVPGLWDLDEIGPMVHAYLWEWDEGVTLIDTGTPGNAEKILSAVEELGYSLDKLQRIIITHADVDHVGSLKEIRRVTGVPIACHTVEKTLLQHPERRRPDKSPLGILVGLLYPLLRLLPILRVDPIKPDELYVDGDKLPEGLIVIHTPGHTPGHISLFAPNKRVLIAGDALNNMGGSLGGPPPLFTPDKENAHRSIWKLWKKYGSDLDVIVFGHGDPVRNDAEAQLKALVDQLYEPDE